MIIGLFFGFLFGFAVEKQVSYCECYRSDFQGAYCQSIKGEGPQGSCHK